MEMQGDHGVRVRVRFASLSRLLPRGLLGRVREFLSVGLEMRDDRGVYIRDVVSAPTMNTS